MGAYPEIIHTMFEAGSSEGKLHNRVVAFTSAVPEEDVSYVVQAFAKKVATTTKKRVVIVDARAFHDLALSDSKNVLRQCAHTEIDNVLILSAVDVAGAFRRKPYANRRLAFEPQIQQAFLKTLRLNFDYVISIVPRYRRRRMLRHWRQIFTESWL